MMKYSINVPNFGDFASPLAFADFARAVEEAGWDGLFVWDHVAYERDRVRDIADPWVLLTAAALATRRIQLGAMVTPVARRRPAKLAREVTTLDRLTGGRVIFGAGLGALLDEEFGAFGESVDPVTLGRRLDEGLEVLRLLWSGSEVSFRGEHFVVDRVTFRPTPVQRPRIPVWIAGKWPSKPPLRRAARWDGVIPLFPGAVEAKPPSVEEFGRFRATLDAFRGNQSQPFDMVVSGASPPNASRARDLVAPLAEAGATWWDERAPFDERLDDLGWMLRRVEHGPPVTGL